MYDRDKLLVYLLWYTCFDSLVRPKRRIQDLPNTPFPIVTILVENSRNSNSSAMGGGISFLRSTDRMAGTSLPSCAKRMVKSADKYHMNGVD